MAKMTRNSLKSLVKECLFEILLEATEKDALGGLTESRRKKTKKSAVRSRRPALDHMAINKPAPPPPPVDVTGLTSDPIMAAIFQDTATTTLIEQAQAERGKSPVGGDAAALKVAQSEPAELFGAASQNWAALAFDE